MDKKIWAGAFVVLGIIDVYAAHVKHDGTLSQAGREVFRTNTPVGKAVWVTGWTGLSAFIIPHIWKWPPDRLSS